MDAEKLSFVGSIPVCISAAAAIVIAATGSSFM